MKQHTKDPSLCPWCNGHTETLPMGMCRLHQHAPELLEALKRVRQAFYVDGTSKALRAAFEGTKELVAKAEGRPA